MQSEREEPELPYTPSHTGRRARVGYLGFEGVGFNDLWPLFAGLIISIFVALKLFIGEAGQGFGWQARTAISLAPFACGFGYLRVLVVGRPPHFKEDLWATLLRLRLDFTDPPFRAFPIAPRLTLDCTGASGPSRSARLKHPMSKRRQVDGGLIVK